jgi:hypothetical protein
MKNIQIAVPSFNGDIPLKVISRLMHLDKPVGFNINFSYVIRVMIDKARNGMAQQCVERKNDYLFFCDSDQIPDKDILVKMVALDKDIVGCPIPSRRGLKEIAVFDKDYKKMSKFKKTQEVGGVGMASTLIKRHVLEGVIEKYPAPFQFETMLDDRDGEEKIVEFSEDINFCRRARELGYEVWCMADVKSLHIGEPVSYWYEDGEFRNDIK